MMDMAKKVSLVFFYSTGDWTQGLTQAVQVLKPHPHPPTHLFGGERGEEEYQCFVHEIVSLTFAQASLKLKILLPPPLE
jgi:hypothetical protein